MKDGIQLIRQADGSSRHLFLEDRLRTHEVRLAQRVATRDDLGGVVEGAVGELRDLQALIGPIVDRALGPLLDRIGRDFSLDPGNPGVVIAADPVDQVGIPELVEVRALVEEPDLSVVAAMVIVVADVQRLVDVGDEMDEKEERVAVLSWVSIRQTGFFGIA